MIRWSYQHLAQRRNFVAKDCQKVFQVELYQANPLADLIAKIVGVPAIVDPLVDVDALIYSLW
jgi:hypothetical protein